MARNKLVFVLLGVLMISLLGLGPGCGSTDDDVYYKKSVNKELAPVDKLAYCSVRVDVADQLINTGIRDPELKTDAAYLYEEVLNTCQSDETGARGLRARAHLGLGLIQGFDVFNKLGMVLMFANLRDLISGMAARSGDALPVRGEFQSRQVCYPINFQDWLMVLDDVLFTVMAEMSHNFAMARELDPAVTLSVEDAWIEILKDDPKTPEDESLVIDFSGEWDATDVAFFQGLSDLMIGGAKFITSYEGLAQNFLNIAMTPDCAPAPGSDEWNTLFGEYGPLVEGGEEKMLEAQALLSSGLYAFRDGFNLLSLETDDQTDDLIAYIDENGNGMYDVGEVWGMAAVDDLLGGLIEGLLGISLADLSSVIHPVLLDDLFDSLALSIDEGVPADLTLKLIKPILGAGMTDWELYSMGIPAINLNTVFNPPWPSLSILDNVKDATGASIIIDETATGDIDQPWPPESPPIYLGRIDTANGSVDPAYSFNPDLDASGNTIGVFGGLYYAPVLDPAQFDAGDNLVGTLIYIPMDNATFNASGTAVEPIIGPIVGGCGGCSGCSGCTISGGDGNASLIPTLFLLLSLLMTRRKWFKDFIIGR